MNILVLKYGLTRVLSVVNRDLIDEAKDYHLMPERRSQMQTFKTRPRCCSDIVGIIYAVGGLTSSGEQQVHLQP